MRYPDRVEDYLEHIAEAITRATYYLQDIDNFADFQQDQRSQDAVLRNIEIIGEARPRSRNWLQTSSLSTVNFRGRKCARCVIW